MEAKVILILAIGVCLLRIFIGPFNIFNSVSGTKTYLKNRRKMEEILKMPDGPELLSALEEQLLEKKKMGIGFLSREEEEFLNYRLDTKDEEDPFERLEDERKLIAFVRNNERYFS